jgi:hypothetical protein
MKPPYQRWAKRGACPQLVEADIGPKEADSGFDPKRRLAEPKSRSATSP